MVPDDILAGWHKLVLIIKPSSRRPRCKKILLRSFPPLGHKCLIANTTLIRTRIAVPKAMVKGPFTDALRVGPPFPVFAGVIMGCRLDKIWEL